jgi:bifunctional DNA-binding transcriptional regulator/antitoxin component of YhaV-PrlF toxin-antitoxin module
MEVLILDELGRIQIPDYILSQLGLSKKTQLSLEIQNGKLILQALETESEIEEEGGVLVVRSFPTENLEAIIDELHEERIARLVQVLQ